MTRYTANLIAFYTPIIIGLGGYLALKVKEEFFDDYKDPECPECDLEKQKEVGD